MLNAAFVPPARKPIVDPVLDEALVQLGDIVNPQLDQSRFDLYLEAIDRARSKNDPLPDLPRPISEACDRVVRLNALGTEGYQDLFVPREVTLAQLRKNIVGAIDSGDKAAGIYYLAAFTAVKDRDVGAMLELAVTPPGCR